jgi:hypothetical protein
MGLLSRLLRLLIPQVMPLRTKESVLDRPTNGDNGPDTGCPHALHAPHGTGGTASAAISLHHVFRLDPDSLLVSALLSRQTLIADRTPRIFVNPRPDLPFALPPTIFIRKLSPRLEEFTVLQ